jgi:hypothetical protein
MPTFGINYIEACDIPVRARHLSERDQSGTPTARRARLAKRKPLASSIRLDNLCGRDRTSRAFSGNWLRADRPNKVYDMMISRLLATACATTQPRPRLAAKQEFRHRDKV